MICFAELKLSVINSSLTDETEEFTLNSSVVPATTLVDLEKEFVSESSDFSPEDLIFRPENALRLASIIAIAVFTGDTVSVIVVDDDSDDVVVTNVFVVSFMELLSTFSGSEDTVIDEFDSFKKCRPYSFKSCMVTTLFGGVTSNVQ